MDEGFEAIETIEPVVGPFLSSEEEQIFFSYITD